MKQTDFPTLAKYIPLLAENKKVILDCWIENDQTQQVLARLGMNAETFRRRFAGLMYDRFLETGSGQRREDAASFLTRMVVFFYNKEIAAQDLFWLWVGLKDAVTLFYFSDATLQNDAAKRPGLLPDLFRETVAILNTKFSAIFFEYTTRLMERQEALFRYSKLIEEHVIVSRTDLGGRINYVSDSFCDITEYDRKELLGKPHNIIRNPEVPKELFKDMWETIQNGKVWDGKVKNSKKNGGFFIAHTTVMPTYGSNGEIDGYVSFRHDITDKVNADTDSLTKAFNRRRFENEFSEQFLKAVSTGSSLSLIVMDVDDFKLINDTHGHAKGDEVLVRIAEAARGNLRKNDLFARWGGEEFVILMAGAMHEAAIHKANQIRKAIEKMVIDDIGTITCSFGAAQLRPGETREEFFKRTDALLYKAKKSGKNRVISS